MSTSAALQLPEAALPLPPYVLGAWLGDGTSAAAQITSADPEIVTHLEAELDESEDVEAQLSSLGVLRDKHIPTTYLRASERQRRDLLAGLLDTDGTVSRSGSVQISVTSLRLAEGIRELVLSLGYRCGRSSKHVKGHTEASSTAYLVSFMSDRGRLPARAEEARSQGARPASLHAEGFAVHQRRASDRLGARSLCAGRQRRPPVSRRSHDDPDAQLDPRS